MLNDFSLSKKGGKRLLEDKNEEKQQHPLRASDVFSGDIMIKGFPTMARKDRLISRCLPEFMPIS
jgi:hypothetical protein